MAAIIQEEQAELANEFINFLNSAITPFHAVQTAKDLLLNAGFLELDETASWENTLEAGGRYFFSRNYSTIVAFAVGAKFSPADSGFTIVGAHTDSPCPKLKPVSKLKKGQFHMLNVQPYGGGLWHTWFDRDLSVAGRVIVRKETGGYAHRLVKIDRPIIRISTLAIHLTNAEERKGFSPNLQTQFMPMLATEASEKLWSEGQEKLAEGDGRHSPLLLHLLAEELGCTPDAIEDFELNVIDMQPSAIGGAFNEFVFSGRLDNLCSSFQALRALIDSSKDDGLTDEGNIRMAILFDHEEIGSQSAEGAKGPVLMQTLYRLERIFSSRLEGSALENFDKMLRRSYVVSSDMAHACHPNYDAKHDPVLKPTVGGGMVIKHNANQRYATNAVSGFMFRKIGQQTGLPSQEFAVRSDTGCGSTIGPITASLSGISTVDVGSPQLSMHSVREVMGVEDVTYGYKHLKAVYELFPQFNEDLSVDK